MLTKIKKKTFQNLINYISKYSTQPILKEEQDYEKQLKEFEKISNLQQKIRSKKPQKEPFAKNLLLGVFDTDILTYPEISNEELDNLNKNLQPAQTFLQQPEIKECKEFTGTFLKKLAKERLLGLQTSQLMGGRELNVTETCRFLEAISEINLKNVVINNDVLGTQTLLKFGNDNLKRKYLQRLIDGDSLSAFCIIEPLASNIDVGKRTGLRGSDGKTWVCF